MTADTKHADLLHRLADAVIRPLEDDDPLHLACREFTRIWVLANALHDNDLEEIKDDIEVIAGALAQKIVGLATTKSALISQVRMVQHDQFPENLLDELIDAVGEGIAFLVPDDRRSRNNAAAVLAVGGVEAQS
jgi:hypothetical protein